MSTESLRARFLNDQCRAAADAGTISTEYSTFTDGQVWAWTKADLVPGLVLPIAADLLRRLLQGDLPSLCAHAADRKVLWWPGISAGLFCAECVEDVTLPLFLALVELEQIAPACQGCGQRLEKFQVVAYDAGPAVVVGLFDRACIESAGGRQ